MFFKKNNEKWPLFLLLFVVGLIIVLIVSVVLYLNYRGEQSAEITDTKPEEARNIDVLENYKQELLSLKNRLIQESEKDKILADFEHTFLSTPVPVDLRDSHLSAFLEYKKIEQNKNVSSLESIKSDLDQVLSRLIGE